jgi:hypothetical protein
MDEVLTVLRSPYTWFALATGAIVGVWWWSMTPNSANLTLMIGVFCLSLGTFLYPWVSSQHGSVRILWTVAVFCVASLAVNYTLWSSTPKAQPAPAVVEGNPGFAYMRPQPPEADGRVRLAIWNKGDKPLTGVRVRMFETVLDPNVPISEKEFIPQELQLGTLAPDHVEITPWSIYPFDGKTMRMYRFEIISETVSVEQELRFRHNERIKSLDDMTRVEKIPKMMGEGKREYLVNQDWHEWTPPFETNDPDAKEKRGLYADFMKHVDETWLSAVARKPDLDQRLVALEHTMNLIGPFIPQTREEWHRNLQDFKSFAFRVSSDQHPRSADLMRREGIDFAVFKQNFQEGIYFGLFPGGPPFKRVTRDDVKSVQMGRD